MTLQTVAPTRRLPWLLAAALPACILAGGCYGLRYDPAKATLPYPAELSRGEVVDIEVFHEGERIRLVNATLRDFSDARIWLNRRYMHEFETLAPGQSLVIPLSAFWDQWGGGPNPGGIFRRFEPTPVALVEIQVDDTAPLVGCIAVPPEESRRRLGRTDEFE